MSPPRQESYVADFDGRSSLLYRFNQKSMSTVKDVVSLRFKSHQAEGVLLHGEGQRGDYMTLELHRGRLDLYLNLGSPSLLSLPSVHLRRDETPPGRTQTARTKRPNGVLHNSIKQSFHRI